MIKIETIGMLDVAKNNPILKSEEAVANYKFMTFDGDVYLIANTLLGDDAYKDVFEIHAGEFLNGFLVKAWEGQKLVIDERHIAFASGEKYEDIEEGTTLLTINKDGDLAIAEEAPESGVYFKVTDKVTLNGPAVKAKVMIA